MNENIISINDKKFNNYETKVSWGEFTVNSYNDNVLSKRTGKSPIILFTIDEIYIEIETTYSKEMFESMKLDKKEDITKYISDITYEDNKGWISIINGEYTCYLIRKNENNFQIILDSKSDEFEKLDIRINTIIEIL